MSFVKQITEQYFSSSDINRQARKFIEQKQYYYIEIPCGDDIYDFTDDHSMKNLITYDDGYREICLEALCEAIKKCKLTKKQRRVLDLQLKGHTQKEIGKITGVTQSSISSMFNGAKNYFSRKRYGGIHKKLQKYIKKNIVIVYSEEQ